MRFMSSKWPVIKEYIGHDPGAITADTSGISKIVLLVMLVIVPVFLPYILSLLISPIFNARYMMTAFAPFCILVSALIFLFIRGKLLASLVFLPIAALSLVNTIDMHMAGSRIGFDWESVAHHVDTHAKTGDLILFSGLEQQVPFDYYSGRKDLVKERYVMGRPKYWQAILERDYVRYKGLDELFKRHDRVWYITKGRGGKDKARALEKLGNRFAQHNEDDFQGIIVHQFFMTNRIE